MLFPLKREGSFISKLIVKMCGLPSVFVVNMCSVHNQCQPKVMYGT